MKRAGRLRPLGRILVATIGLLALGVATLDALPPPKERWQRFESRHFTVFSNAGNTVTRRIVGDLESLRATLAALSPGTRLSSPVPTTIYVFENDAAFRPYKPRYNGKPAQLAGYFQAHEHGNFVAINGDPDGQPERLIYHEYLHEILRNNHPDLPLWLNEGLAELYSTFEVSGGKAKIGLPIRSHLAELAGSRLMSFDRLQAIDRDDRDYNEGTRRGLFYAQSWAFAHYLLIGNAERQEQFRSFLELLAQDVAPDAAFALAFAQGEGPADPAAVGAALEREVATYIRGYQLPALAAEVSWSVDSDVTVTALDRAETLFRLGDLLAHGDSAQVPAARAHLEASLAARPEHPGALARLAMLDLEDGQTRVALARYRRASTLAPDDPAILFELGNALLADLRGESLSPMQVSAADRARLLEARSALARSTALRPGYAEAWAQLGFTYTIEAEPTPEARRVLETAFRLLPSRMDVAFNLLLTYTRLGAREAAEHLVNRVIAVRADSETVAASREALLHLDVALANALLEADRLDEALPVLEALAAATRDPTLGRTVVAQIAQLRLALAERDFVAAYNRAVMLANRGDHGAAAAVLEALIPTLDDDEWLRDARQLLGRIRAARR